MSKSVCVISLNVDFQTAHHTVRFQRICDGFLKVPDLTVIALQEVPAWAIRFFVSRLGPSFPYHRTSHRRHHVDTSYHQVIFARQPWHDSGIVPFEETLMDRQLLWGTIILESGPLTVATVHLESGASMQKIRDLQSSTIARVLGERPDTLLLGDMNTETALSGISGRWNEVTNDRPTWFLERLVPDKIVHKRYDRAFTSPSFHRRARMETIGSEFLTGHNVWTSDHDALSISIQ